MAHKVRTALLEGLVALLTPPRKEAFAGCIDTDKGKRVDQEYTAGLQGQPGGVSPKAPHLLQGSAMVLICRGGGAGSCPLRRGAQQQELPRSRQCLPAALMLVCTSPETRRDLSAV